MVRFSSKKYRNTMIQGEVKRMKTFARVMIECLNKLANYNNSDRQSFYSLQTKNFSALITRLIFHNFVPSSHYSSCSI